MRAIVVDRLMEPEDLVVREVEGPRASEGHVTIDVRAAGCNFSDLLLLRGEYQVKPPLPFTPGAEVAGVLLEVGDGVEELRPGDRVLAWSGLGGFAERCSAPARDTYRLPEGMSFETGASLPITYPTAYAALVDRAALEPGETLLVHAAAGGVGTAAVQVGKALGARVVAAAGGPEKLEFARACGADHAIDSGEEDFVARVLELTDGAGADVIYDPVGGDTFDRSLKCIAWNGRLLVIGFASGTIPEVKTNRILLKNISVIGLHWSAFPERQPERIPEIFAELLELHASGLIEPVIYGRFALDEVPTALRALASRKTHGKVIIEP